jgi:hypothetical protein
MPESVLLVILTTVRALLRYFYLTPQSLSRTVYNRPKNRFVVSLFFANITAMTYFQKNNTIVSNIDKINLFSISWNVRRNKQLLGTFMRSSDISVRLCIQCEHKGTHRNAA